MEGAILSTQNNNRFRMHLKSAANALCARTLPKQRRSEADSTAKHHTYPRTTPPKRAPISCRMEPLVCNQQPQAYAATFDPPAPITYHSVDAYASDKHVHSKAVKLKGSLAREVASAWGCRVGAPEQAAPADRVQSLFNDIELYPTKTQVFEMLVCARQCARRKSLTLTFGEFCVFAAELRRCSRQAKQTKPESPQWTVDKDLRDKDVCKHLNGSEASPSPCEVFLGGSCNPTTWRSDIAIPILKKMGITYFNPQVEDWSKELMEVEHRAKAAARALLFVLDSETRAVGASVEAAHLAAAPRDLLLVLRPYKRHQLIGDERISDQEYIELSRARATLQEAVERRGLPAFTDIPAALRCARAVLRGARTHPRHSLGHTILRLKRVYDAAGGRTARLPRPKAVDAVRDVTKAPRELADKCIPANLETVDFETFCAAVAELASDSGLARTVEGETEPGLVTRVRRAFRSLRDLIAHPVTESQGRNGHEAKTVAAAEAGAIAGAKDPAERIAGSGREGNGLRVHNDRLRAYGRKLGLFIPKAGAQNRTSDEQGSCGSPDSGDSVFTPGTERRLERLPAMLGAPTHDVYLGGAFPSSSTRPEEMLRREGFTYVIPRANDYTRMFSAPARRSAAMPESPHRDKKPRSAVPDENDDSGYPGYRDEDVQLRDRVTHADPGYRDRKSRTVPDDDDIQFRDRAPHGDHPDPNDRLSASDFYKVTEDITPQPFKGTYDEDLLLGSRVLVFSLSSSAPCFSAMVLAAHYMGLRPNATVLLIQSMDHKQAHPYSEAAVRDYNRGRHYLADLAQRSGVPVCDNLEDTMRCVLDRLRPTL